MRALALVFLVGLAVVAGPLASAHAKTWTVEVSGTGAGGAFQASVQVNLPDPSGSTTVSVLGVPVVVTETAESFSLATTGELRVQGECLFSVAAAGSAPIQATDQRLSAFGEFSGKLVVDCIGGLFHDEFPVQGQFAAQSDAAAPPGTTTVETVSGTVQVRTPVGPQTISFTLTPGGEIRTGANGSITLVFLDGSRVEVGPNTIFVLEEPEPASLRVKFVKGLARFFCRTLLCPRVVTATVAIAVRSTVFSVEFSQVRLLATFTIAVQEGTVELVDRRGLTIVLTGGEQITLSDLVPRVFLLLPAEQGSVVQGGTNTFSWTALDGAVGYLFEFTRNPTGFSQPNSPTVEFTGTTIQVSPGAFTEADGIVEFPIFIPEGTVPSGTRVHWRIFAVDAGGQILAGTTSSDPFTLIVQ